LFNYADSKLQPCPTANQLGRISVYCRGGLSLTYPQKGKGLPAQQKDHKNTDDMLRQAWEQLKTSRVAIANP